MANSITPFVPSTDSTPSVSNEFHWVETRHSIGATSGDLSTGSNWAEETYFYDTTSFPDFDTSFMVIYSWPTIRVTFNSSSAHNIQYDFGFVQQLSGNTSIQGVFVGYKSFNLSRGTSTLTIPAGTTYSRNPTLSSNIIGIGFSFDNTGNSSSITTSVSIPSYTVTISRYCIDI